MMSKKQHIKNKQSNTYLRGNIMTLKYYFTLLKTVCILIFLMAFLKISWNYEANKIEMQRMTQENNELKENIIAVGGIGLDISKLEKMDALELAEGYQQKFALINYDWKYPEIGYPVNPETSYVTSEKAGRILDNGYEEPDGTDIIQKDSLKIVSSISGFCKIDYDKWRGNNIIISGYILMRDDRNKEIQRIKKVKVRFSHLSRIDVIDGKWIKKGECIGLMGNTGRCVIKSNGKWREINKKEKDRGYGMHLDFCLEIDGVKRNPFTNGIHKNVRL